jgi:acetyl-CoA acetyltransferase
MMSSRSVVLIAPVRTAIGTFDGSLKEIPAPELGALAIKAAVARAGLHPDEVGTAVMGNVVQAGAKMNPARQAAIHAGLPVSVPAMTVNRVCGSGAQAIVSAAQEILLGAVDVAVAGGMENMDLAPTTRRWEMHSALRRHPRRRGARRIAARLPVYDLCSCSRGRRLGPRGPGVSNWCSGPSASGLA